MGVLSSKLKRNPDGSTRYKAWLVIIAYEQMDYVETYAPAGKLSIFRLLLSLAEHYNWRINHHNVVPAFLNPDVDDDTLFMEQPDGWPDETRILVIQLQKALHGLKQAPHLWYHHINAFRLSLGFVQSEADPNLYIRNTSKMLPILYVDHMLLGDPPSAENEAEDIKKALATTYKITNLGTAHQIVAIEIP